MLTYEQHLRKEHVKFLISLYDTEMEEGLDLGPYPTYEQFVEIYAEELASN